MSWLITPSFTQWTPALISTALWLDAADASTVTADGSNLVSQINDKSGNARHFTASTTARPTYTSGGQNARNVLTFNGTSNSLSRANYVYGTTHSLFAVFKYTAASTITNSTPGFALMRGSSDNTAIYAGEWSGAFASERLGYYAGSSGFAKTDQNITATSPLLISFALNASQAGSVRRLNGTADFTSTVGPNVPSSIQYIGSFDGTANFFPGLFCELVITATFLTGNVIEQTEGYLAHKWGLTANLPADHPYKVNPPAP